MGKDLLHEFLETVRQHDTARGNLRGLFHVVVGRRITKTDGTPVTNGLTWRALAIQLKRLRWDRECVQELGLNSADLPMRDRQRFWYTAIAQSGLDTPDAVAAGNRLLAPCRTLGYVIGPAPGVQSADKK